MTVRSSRSALAFTTAALAAIAAGLLATPAVAQTAPDAAQADAPEIDSADIVVTAQKRTERLQDVPLAVTAIGGEALASRQINDTSSLTQAVPSLTFQQGNNPTNTSFRVRGVGTSLFSQGVESSVSVVVDGVVAARQAQSFADFADIERVEILRGPQGTLFGKNATAGVISVVTARPSSRLEGKGDVTIAEGDEYRAKGTISGPISDTLRARITGYYNNVGGYVNNLTTGDKVNSQESWGVRGKLDWDATSNLNFLLSADYRKSDADCCVGTLVATTNPVIAQLNGAAVASPTNRSVVDNGLTFANSTQKTVSLQGDWDLGASSITSITAYQNYKLANNFEVDRTNSTPVRFVGTGASYAGWDYNFGTVDLKQVSQELRLGSNGHRDLTYVVGVYYSHLDLDRTFARRRATCATGVIGQACAAPVYQSAQSVANLKSNSVSLFGQAEYRIVGGLKAIGGLRVQYENVAVSGTTSGPIQTGDNLFPGTVRVSGRRSADDTAVTGKAGLQYEFNRNAQVYGSYTRGYKGLGFDTEISANFATQNPVLPEHVNAYEIGFKGQTADRTFSLAGALFLADYTDLQIQANRSDAATGVTTFVQTNAGSSRTKGVELEATLRPSESFSVNAAFTYAKATIDVDGLSCPLQFQATAPTLTANFPVNACYRRQTVVNGTTVTSGPLQDVRGGALPASPQLRINVSPRFDHAIPGTDFAGFVQAGINYQSKQQFAVEQDPLLVQPSYVLVDLSVGIHQIDGRYSLTAYVKNVFDVNYYTTLSHGSLLATTASPNDLYANFNKDADRYFGATFGVKF